jgi:O-antigen/teichoic acid export membrane protein
MEIPVLLDIMSRLLMLVGVAALAAGVTVMGASPAVRLDLVLLLAATTGVLASGVMFLAAQHLLRFRPVLYDRLLLWPMVRDSAPLAIVLVVGIIHYRIDVFILAAMKGSGAVGLYGVATKLLDVSLAVSAMFMSVAFPVLSQRAFGEQALLRRAFQKSLDFMLILGAGIAIFAAVLSPTLTRLVGGSGFGDAAAPLAVIAFAVPVMFVNQVFSHMVVAANRQLIGVPVVLLAALANIGLNVLLIPHLGVTAPALVTDITESLSAIGLAVVMIRHYRFGPSLLAPARILAAAALAGSATLLLRSFNPIVAAMLGLAVYATALVLTGAIGRDDVTALLRGEAPA